LRAGFALMACAALAGCWDWDRFVPSCDQCACEGDVCVDGRCEPANPITSIAHGQNHACYVAMDGAVFCVGNNDYGQLGIGSFSAEAERPNGQAIPVRAIATGYSALGSGSTYYQAGLDGDGEVHVWGLHFGANAVGGTGETTPQPLEMSFDRLASGGEHLCGLAGRALYCIGANSYGQAGVGHDDPVPSFARVPGEWIDVSAGNDFTCGIQQNETDRLLYCWGRNDHGQLGLGDVGTDRSTPEQVGTADDWTQVSAGKDFACGLREGEVYCWGANTDGFQIAQAALGDYPTPQGPLQIGAEVVDDAVLVDCGRFHGCLLRGAERSIHCWGNNECGAIGDGTLENRAEIVPAITDVFGHGASWRELSAGHHTSCATRENGALFCWGRGGGRMARELFECGEDLPGVEMVARTPARLCL
jgi:alpha-tubulin suppressor-like RCC1 family protein